MLARRTLLVALAVAIVVAVMSTAALGGGAQIETSGQTWSPRRVTIDRGSRVVWRATSGSHNVSAYGGNWTYFQAISPSADPTAARRFRRRGTFKFRCTLHSTLTAGVCDGMCGRVRVTA